MNTELQSKGLSKVNAFYLVNIPGKVTTLRVSAGHVLWCADLITAIQPHLPKGRRLFRLDTRQLADYPQERFAALPYAFDNLDPAITLVVIDSPRELVNDPGNAREVAKVDILINRIAKESNRSVLLIKYT